LQFYSEQNVLSSSTQNDIFGIFVSIFNKAMQLRANPALSSH